VTLAIQRIKWGLFYWGFKYKFRKTTDLYYIILEKLEWIPSFSLVLQCLLRFNTSSGTSGLLLFFFIFFFHFLIYLYFTHLLKNPRKLNTSRPKLYYYEHMFLNQQKTNILPQWKQMGRRELDLCLILIYLVYDQLSLILHRPHRDRFRKNKVHLSHP
jgi:hypothetical protein